MFPLPLIRATLEQLHATIFSKLDLRSAYNLEVPIHPEDE